MVSKAAKHHAAAAEAKSYKCTEPNCEFVTKVSKFSKQELGRHLKFTHGIVGVSSSSKTMQKKKVANTKAMEKTNGAITEEAAPSQKRSYNKSIREDDTAALIFVGYIKASCETEATKLGIPQANFTRRVAELLYAYSLR